MSSNQAAQTANNVANWLWLSTSTLSLLLAINEWIAWSSCKGNSICQYIYYKITGGPATGELERSGTVVTQEMEGGGRVIRVVGGQGILSE
jgi:hypothetical protein